MDINRKPNESLVDYTYRLLQARDDGLVDLDRAEIYEMVFGEVVSSDHARKVLTGIKKFIERLKEEGYENITDDVLIKELQIQQRELYKERQKLRDEKNEYNAWLREQARMELFFERIDEAVDRLIEKKPIEIPPPLPIINNDCEMFAAFADAHYGVDFKVLGFDNIVLNEYNPEIFTQRMWKFRDEIIDFCKFYNTNKLHLVDLGDSIEGLIKLSALKALRGNVVDDIMDYAEFICEWLKDLNKRGQLIIDFYTSEGNHSDLRVITGNKGDFPHENLERIYSRVLKKEFKDNPNISIKTSLDGLNYFDICGYKFLTAHGNNDNNIKNSIKEYEDTYKIDINYLIVGHLHTKQEIEVAKGKETIRVRSIMGINDFSTSIKKTSDAGATMFTVHKGYGKKYVNEIKF